MPPDKPEPYGPDSDITPPPRGLEYVRPVIYEERLALDVLCDCGQAVIAVLACERPDAHLDGTEIPYTCPGCLSVTWLTINLAQLGGHDGA